MQRMNLFLFMLAALALVSCNDGDDGKYAEYLVAKPLTMGKAEFKQAIDIIAPIPLEESGKIYVYGEYIFVNEKYKGVHVIDNSDPRAPKKIAFIKIPGNVDVSVKGNYLYADSIMDLIVLDISDINNIKTVNRLENVLRDNVVFPFEADIYAWQDIDYENDIVIGWETVKERRLIEEVQVDFSREFDVMLSNAAQNTTSTGQGGSLARFKIVNDYLYAVDSHTINVFNIQDLENPKDLEDVYAGFDIETIFNRGDQLFLGSMRGMYIYDISAPATPTLISEFEHGTACDPVVVDGDYAYVTLRGGNMCGATESGLFIVDISDITKPELVKTYPMDGPYGLGVKDEKLFVCDGASGLKVYDKTNVRDLVQLNHFKDVETFDVIPMEDNLLMIGKEIIYQYEYLENKIKLISTFKLN
ncbi:LVIVD repeat-containing protein [Arenibacter sp. ARW7G5Y1]|uniref:LVIVD repeat-containing protein n=1 Tax=Arenibacter sp. ARW7G5Y1 TaxID=2135619 RepID=UPI000D76E6DC|nr:hypothetical protein [Arenibacter sp. ARW7G5Y1]PXX31735.1 hypothetical protein C7972_101574 [Arenibacter sp. ARW7G5Y1]